MSMLMSNSLGIPVSRFGGSSFLGTLLFAMYVPLVVLSVLVVVVPIIVASTDLSMSSSFFIVRASSDPPPSALVLVLLLLWRRRRLPKRASFGDLFPFFRSPPPRNVGVVVVVEHEQNRDDALRIIILCVCAFACVCVCALSLYMYRKRVRAACVVFCVEREFVSLGRYSFDFFRLARALSLTRMDPNASAARERGDVAAFVWPEMHNRRPSATKKKKKSDLIVDQKKSFLDVTQKKEKRVAVRVPCGTYISSEKEKRDDARIFVFFRMELSLSIFFRYARGARLVCEWFFFCVKR
jgi:hypothetical protein